MAEKELTAEEKRIKELQDKYSLTDEQLQEFFEDVIIPRFVGDRKQSEDPQAVYLSGQPGAGKSSVSRLYAKKMGGEDYVVVFGADDLRAMLPYAKEVQENYEMDYPFITKRDSGKLRTWLMNYCFDNKINMVVESIFANENDYKMPVFEQAKKAGFKMGVAFLGVDENLSSLGIYKRYNDQKNLTGRGFAPTLEMHDKAYALMPLIITGMVQNPNIDWVKIYDRDGECHGNWNKLEENHMQAKHGKQKTLQVPDSFSHWRSMTTDLYMAKLKECTSILEKSREASFEKDDYDKSMASYKKVIKDMTLREEAQTTINTVKKLRNRHIKRKDEVELKKYLHKRVEFGEYTLQHVEGYVEKSYEGFKEIVEEGLRIKAIELAQSAGMPIAKNANIDYETACDLFKRYDEFTTSYKSGRDAEKNETGEKTVSAQKWRDDRDNAKKTTPNQKPNTSGLPRKFRRGRGER